MFRWTHTKLKTPKDKKIFSFCDIQLPWLIKFCLWIRLVKCCNINPGVYDRSVTSYQRYQSLV